MVTLYWEEEDFDNILLKFLVDEFKRDVCINKNTTVSKYMVYRIINCDVFLCKNYCLQLY